MSRISQTNGFEELNIGGKEETVQYGGEYLLGIPTLRRKHLSSTLQFARYLSLLIYYLDIFLNILNLFILFPSYISTIIFLPLHPIPTSPSAHLPSTLPNG